MAIALTKRQNKIKGGEIISRMLAKEGVKKIFGIIDGTYFGFYSTMDANGIGLVTPRHETCAAHMAGTYARLTGELGVCIASNGPGVANILPGVAVENAEGNRVLLITSCRREGIAYPDRGGTFQCFPQVDVIRPMSKFSCAVHSVDRLAEVMRDALRISYEGRPGVVHVDVPESIMNGSYDLDPTWLRPVESYRCIEPIVPTPGSIKSAARMLAEAKLPMLHIGSGVIWSGATDEVRELAELIESPITTSWAARTAIDERMSQAIPMVFIDAVNKTRNQADVVLAIGSRIGETDWWGKAPYWAQPEDQRWIQVDIDAAHLGRIRPVDLAVRSDAKMFLQALIHELRHNYQSQDLIGRKKQIAALKKKCAARRKSLDKHLADDSIPMATARVPHACQQVFSDDAVMVIDGGNTAVWSNFFHEVRHINTIITTPKMGMLGAGVSQAVAAKIARPNSPVYCIIGDGAMGMHQQEVETAIRNNLQVIYLVICDKQWGMVKMNQQFMLKPVKTILLKSLGPDETINADLSETRFDDLGRSMGAYGERVADPNGLKEAIKRAQASGRTAVIHVDVDPVKHMWAPELKTFKDMHGEPKG